MEYNIRKSELVIFQKYGIFGLCTKTITTLATSFNFTHTNHQRSMSSISPWYSERPGNTPPCLSTLPWHIASTIPFSSTKEQSNICDFSIFFVLSSSQPLSKGTCPPSTTSLSCFASSNGKLPACSISSSSPYNTYTKISNNTSQVNDTKTTNTRRTTVQHHLSQ